MTMEYPYFIGVDEVGRGPVAGPVYVCALRVQASDLPVILSTIKIPLRDSKKLTEKMRERWFAHIQKCADEGLLKYAISYASAEEIDTKGIAPCIKSCAEMSVQKLCSDKTATKVMLDGGLSISEDFIQESIIKGDETVPVISLASIVAKVSRDEVMKKMSDEYPEYGFGKHKGYGTSSHMHAIERCGLTTVHRKSFLKKFL